PPTHHLTPPSFPTRRSSDLTASGPGGRTFNFSAFERALIDDLIPSIDANFRTIADQPHRAMAGLSMGGMQTRAITLAHLDKFSQDRKSTRLNSSHVASSYAV